MRERLVGGDERLASAEQPHLRSVDADAKRRGRLVERKPLVVSQQQDAGVPWTDAAQRGLDQLPLADRVGGRRLDRRLRRARSERQPGDRKSTRLNSSHANISYAVFCLKKKRLRNK